MNERWEHLPHGADITICGLGDSEAAAFEQAALALTAIVTDPATVVAAVPVKIACEAPDRELLLVEWLNALIYEMATRRMLFAQFEVRIDDHQLTAPSGAKRSTSSGTSSGLQSRVLLVPILKWPKSNRASGARNA